MDEEETHAINIILTERYLELGPQISEVDDQGEILGWDQKLDPKRQTPEIEEA